VPAYGWWNESLHGVARAGIATVFPQAIGLAATFDVPLIGEMAEVIGNEARAKHHQFVREGRRGRYQGLTFWSPNVNIFRDPRWGRGQETYGEDPFLTGRIGVAFVKGLQGDDPRYYRVIATAKHFAVHSGPEPNRHTFDARPTERDLWDTYLPAFRDLVQEGRVASVMSAYNRINGESATASKRFLNDILRAQWGFSGYVVSDCGAVDDIFRRHKIVATAEEASALSVTRGCDLECGGAFRALKESVARGFIKESDLDAALHRLVVARVKLGMFDPPERVRWAQIPYSVNDAPEHDRLARRVAQSSIVLLKNSGVLPLRKDLRTIAVVGPTADDLMSLLGNYNGTPSKPITILAGIRNAVSLSTRVVYERGVDLVEGRRDPRATGAIDTTSPGSAPGSPMEAALAAARSADAVVFVGGLTAEIEGEEMPVSYPGFAGGDRTDIELPAVQRKMLEALQATGKPVVLVLTTGSALGLRWAKETLPAIVLAWYPGQQGGNAVADVLFGDANPAGRLPVTFYESAAQLPPFADYGMEGRTYRYFRGEPVYPFGFGLSYTRFEYSGIQLSRSALGVADRLEVSVGVKNAGARAGDEVVQLYVRRAGSAKPAAIRTLRGFERVGLAAGQQKRVRFTIVPERDLATYDEERKAYVAASGTYEIEVGSSSRDVRARAHVTVR
jgi:beta-glucosidase